MIDRIAYDDERRELWITFRENGRYLYAAVPPAVYEQFRLAGSAGQFFNARIKDRFACHRDPARRRFGPHSTT